jgi:methionyl aminopeptidase
MGPSPCAVSARGRDPLPRRTASGRRLGGIWRNDARVVKIMSVSIESRADLVGLRRAGRVVAEALREMRRSVTPGMTTAELDAVGERVFRRYGARSAPMDTYGFPGVNCISVNDEAVHGVPSRRRSLRRGDLVKLDVTAKLDGYVADAAITHQVGEVDEESQALKRCAEAALTSALSVVRDGVLVNEVGRAVQSAVAKHGFCVLTELSGHGVGRKIHEPPTIYNTYVPSLQTVLRAGMVITVEPIIAATTSRVTSPRDGWTVKTSDGSRSAHAEHTIIVTRSTPLVVTRPPRVM